MNRMSRHLRVCTVWASHAIYCGRKKAGFDKLNLYGGVASFPQELLKLLWEYSFVCRGELHFAEWHILQVESHAKDVIKPQNISSFTCEDEIQ